MPWLLLWPVLAKLSKEFVFMAWHSYKFCKQRLLNREFIKAPSETEASEYIHCILYAGEPRGRTPWKPGFRLLIQIALLGEYKHSETLRINSEKIKLNTYNTAESRKKVKLIIINELE